MAVEKTTTTIPGTSSAHPRDIVVNKSYTNDTVIINAGDGTDLNNVTINTHEGADKVAILPAAAERISGTLRLDTGSDDDSVVLNSTNLKGKEKSFVNLGGGSDTLTVNLRPNSGPATRSTLNAGDNFEVDTLVVNNTNDIRMSVRDAIGAGVRDVVLKTKDGQEFVAKGFERIIVDGRELDQNDIGLAPQAVSKVDTKGPAR